MISDLGKAIAEVSRLVSAIDADYETEDLVRELIPKIYIPHNYSAGNRPVATCECGSVRLADTAKGLYRALFLFEPGCLDFSRMYKSCLFAVCSPDGTLVADFEFYKCELALYFSATDEHIEGRLRSVRSGLPGAANGVRAKTDLAIQWFSLLPKLLNREWEIYSGNDFKV